MSEEKIIIKQSTPIYGTLGIIFGFVGAGILSIVFAILGIITSPILMALLNMPNIIIYQNQGVFL